MSQSSSYTGRARQRRTRWIVRLADRAARLLIVVGGISTIAAVSLVAVFLLWVAVPLFQSPHVLDNTQAMVDWPAGDSQRLAIDDSQALGWALAADGTLTVFRLDAASMGQVLTRQKLFDEPEITALSVGVERPDVALGFADGSVRLGRIDLAHRIVPEDSIAEGHRRLPPRQLVRHGDGLLERLESGQFRLHEVRTRFEEPFSAGETPIRLIDLSQRSSGYAVCTLSEGGQLDFFSVVKRRDLLARRDVIRTTRAVLPFATSRGEPPLRVLVNGVGDNALVIWPSGRMQRFDVRSLAAPQLAEELDLVPEDGARLTAVDMLVGKSTLVVGDSLGRVRGWFGTKPPDAGTPDGVVMVAAHDLAAPGSPVRCLAPAARSRMVAAGYDDGRVRLFFMTTEQLLLELDESAPHPVAQLALAPRGDGLLSVQADRLQFWSVEMVHPEVSLASLFAPVWYEGANAPAHVWQSTGGTIDFEPKFGLVPLIFGTLKATFYSLAFGVPLALLAAIYTSEFLTPRAKATIKPAIELMASLPSVVLGFLAAQVFAPYVEQFVPAALALFVTVPLAFLTGAFLWQLVPHQARILADRWRWLLIVAAVPAGVAAAYAAGPPLEQVLFDGDIMAWLDGQQGSAAAGWMMMLLPAAALVVVAVVVLQVNPILRRLCENWSRAQVAAADLAVYATGVVASLALTWAAAQLLAGAGWDLRGAVFDTYIQRNATIVGFAMGFAIIPIIYTIAEDALTAVPEHLRSASLGCGATPWQTALRVVIPTAMSGLFSAVMVGMGRAVGETMIVLMAGGNTPIMELNPFNGFRTLPANLAVELPEAVQYGTHFRVLFFSAVVLFAMTFALNTAAEVVRQRFRKRAVEL